MKSTPKLLGREPALWLGAVTMLVQMGSALGLDLSETQQGALNAVAVAALGLITAAFVSVEKALPRALGLLQALLAAGVAFGLGLDPEVQSSIMSTAAAVASLIVRSQVTVPTPPDTSRLEDDEGTDVEHDDGELELAEDDSE